MKRLLLLTGLFLVACDPSPEQKEESVNLFDGKTYLECSSKEDKPAVYVELSQPDKSANIYLKQLDPREETHERYFKINNWSAGSISGWHYTYIGGKQAANKFLRGGSWEPTDEDKVQWLINRVDGTITSEDRFFTPESLINYHGDCEALLPEVGFNKIQQTIATYEEYKENKNKEEEKLEARKKALTESERKF